MYKYNLIQTQIMAKATHEDVTNPFCHYLYLTKFQKLQIFLMSVTIAPLRFVIGFSLFIIVWILAKIFTIGADSTTPASSVRKILYQTLQILGRAILFVCGFHYFKVKGKRASFSQAPVLLMLPHSSYWDILLFFVTSPFPSPLSKFENSQIPVFGSLMKVLQPILVHRSNAASKHDTINAIKNRLSSQAQWPQLGVFPEGTCTNKKLMIKFKLGAFVSGTPVQPVILKYNNSIDVSTWTEISPSALYMIWLSLCQLSLNAEIEYLSVYKPDVEERNDPKLYATNVQKYLAKYLNVPCSNYSFEDRLLMKRAGKLKFSRLAAAVGFYDVSKATKMKIETALKLLEEFSIMSSLRSDGLVSVEDFSKYLKIPVCLELQNLFDKIVDHTSSELTFRQYLFGYTAVVNHFKDEAQMLAAYSKYCQFQNSHTNSKIVQNIMEAANQQCVIATKDDFVVFVQSSPLLAMLMLLTNGDEAKQVITNHIPTELHLRKKPKYYPPA